MASTHRSLQHPAARCCATEPINHPRVVWELSLSLCQLQPPLPAQGTGHGAGFGQCSSVVFSHHGASGGSRWRLLNPCNPTVLQPITEQGCCLPACSSCSQFLKKQEPALVCRGHCRADNTAGRWGAKASCKGGGGKAACRANSLICGRCSGVGELPSPIAAPSLLLGHSRKCHRPRSIAVVWSLSMFSHGI